jgi:membrane peptidoglycan carboxypeptidase
MKAYSNPRLHLLDYAYLLDRNPLELMCAGALFRNSGLSWKQIWAQSAEARRLASNWLFQTRHRGAQDKRLRIHFEQDAFVRMSGYWRELGFPFPSLTPSLATAIGSSSDRPVALADLLGIMVNDGMRMPNIRLQEMRFAEGSPYHTIFEPAAPKAERVLAEPAARALRQVMAGVVEGGTAVRLAGAFVAPDGKRITVGGKTGSGDNRFEAVGRHGQVIDSRSVSRTATFVFYIGDRYYGVMLAYVPGERAAHYRFTSSLPVAILKLLAPSITARMFPQAEAAEAAGNRRQRPAVRKAETAPAQPDQKLPALPHMEGDTPPKNANRPKAFGG